MIKTYLIILICAIIFGVYFYGKSIGISKCENQNLQNQIITTEQNKKDERIINDTVYKTGLGDIRRILRDKYTIAE